MNATRFQTARTDGRTDSQVIYDLTQAAEPETVYPYQDLIDALQEGVDRPIGRERVGGAVRAANRLLLSERRRYLGSIRNVGYRVLRSDEHLPTAITKKRCAEGHIERGLSLLRQVRLDELEPTYRTLHEGQLMVMAGIYQVMQASARRHAQQEQLIVTLQDRIQRIEERIEGRIDDEVNPN